MRLVSLCFLAAFGFWAASVVSVDLATSKIPNKKILLGAQLLLAGLCAQLFVTYLGYKGTYPVFVRWEFYPLFAQHLGWSVLAGGILWYAEIWPAGDAKFFMLVSAALPVMLPEIRHFPGNLFLSLLVNIFVLASVFAIGRYITSEIHTVAPSDSFNTLWADLKGRVSPMFAVGDRASALAYPFNLTFLFVMQQLISLELRGEVVRFLARADIFYFFLFLLWDKVGAAFRSPRWMRVTVCCYLLYFFAGYFFFYEHLAGMVVVAISRVLKFSLLLFFGRFVLSFLMERKDLVYVSAEELVPGMVLSSTAHSRLKANSHFEGAFDDCFRDGLEEEQLVALKDWLKKLPLESAKIEIVRGRPFALWISAGAALSLLLGRNFAQLLK